jgi:hypothetical protein
MRSPLLVFARRIKHPLDVSVQRPHHANARHHGRAAELDDLEQGLDRGLPGSRFCSAFESFMM